MSYDDKTKKPIDVLYHGGIKKEFNDKTIKDLANDIINQFFKPSFLEIKEEIKNKFINLSGYPLKFEDDLICNSTVSGDELLDYHKLVLTTTRDFLYVIQNITRELDETKERLKNLENTILKQ